MADGDFVFFFFRETAAEYINCGKVNTIIIIIIIISSSYVILTSIFVGF